MPRLTAAEELLAEADPLELPVPGGKVYRVAPLDAERWLRLMALDAVGMAQRLGMDADPEDVVEVSKLGQRDVLYTALGSTLDEMAADNVDPRIIIAASRAASAFHRYGFDAAEESWAASLGNPSARLLAATRPVPRRPQTSPTSTSTGEASTTPPPASGSGTSSP